jgi:ATP-binding cassette subfamily F protein 1
VHFPVQADLSPPIIEVIDVNWRYELRDGTWGPYLFKDLSFGMDLQSRVCIVGPNGVGKTTLLNIITGELKPKEGEVRQNQRLRVGKYSQHFVDVLPMGETPVEYLRRKYQDESYQTARNLLGKFGLEGHAHEISMRDLSGGQKARVVLCDLSLMRPHIMFLDEPTNNLDIETIDALCTAINNWNGGIILVSHDERLIAACECVLWVVNGDQRVRTHFALLISFCSDLLHASALQNVKPWPGNFDSYKDHLLEEMKAYEAAMDKKYMTSSSGEKMEIKKKGKKKDEKPKSKFASIGDLKI